MIEVGRIGFNMTLMGDADKRMLAFSEAIEKSYKSMDLLNRQLRILNPAMKDLDGILATVNKNFSGLNTRLGNTTTRTERLAIQNYKLSASYRNVAVSAIEANHAMSGGRGGRGGGGGGHGNHLGRMLGREMGGGELGGFAMGRMMGGAPMAAVGAGIVGLMLTKASYEAASRFQQAQAQFAGQGFGASANTSATQAALNMNLRGVSSTDAMQAINDAATVTRNVPEAIQLAPSIAKMEFANKTNYAMKGKDFTNQDEMRMLQFAELRSGTTDSGKFLKTLDFIQKVYSSDAARLLTHDLRSMGRQGSAFIAGLSDQDLAGLSVLVQSQGGQRTATGLNTMQTSLFKGQNMRTGKKAVAELERLGIYGSDGKLKGQYTDQVAHRPLDFIYSTLVPAMAKVGVTNSADQARELSVLFTQSTQRVIMQAIAQVQRVMAQEALVPKASGIQAGYMSALSTNPGHTAAFEKDWDSLMTALGKFSSPAVNKGMDILMTFFEGLTKTLNGGDAWNKNFTQFWQHPFKTFFSSPHTDGTNNLGVNTNPFPRAAPTVVQVNHTSHIDGQAIMESTSYHQARAMGAPQTGTTQFNGSAMLGATTPSFVGN